LFSQVAGGDAFLGYGDRFAPTREEMDTMRHLPKLVAVCLAAAVFAPAATADEKDRFKEAFKRQREQEKKYEERLREDMKRSEKRDREERKRYEEQLREDGKRQREFDREGWKRGGWPQGGFGGSPGVRPTHQFPEQGSPYAQPVSPYGGGYAWGPATSPQVQYPHAQFPSPYTQSDFGVPPHGPYLGRAYGFNGHLRVTPLAPQPVLPSYPPVYYPSR
jgi:hypothetical protein